MADRSLLPDVNLTKFRNQPIFCFTSDIEWSPEWAIAEMLNLFDRHQVPLTPYITHPSKVLQERYGQYEMKVRAGVHPNFSPSSSHGRTQSQVIDFVCSLWPEAISYRSHCFFDHTQVSNAFAERGFLYDSNLCLFLQPNCAPLHHSSGMLRFPVFWEDDVHLRKGLSFKLDAIKTHLDGPGLKVFNIHPLLLALNAPSIDYYAAHKYLYNSNDTRLWRNSVFPGHGVRRFLEDVLNYVKANGHHTTFLHDLFLEIIGARPDATDPNPQSHKTEATRDAKDMTRATLAAYQVASRERKAEITRRIFDARDAQHIYATSRDFNLRELEISFIAEHLDARHVLDIGCGNGYTILSLAKRVRAQFIGIDFSPKMLGGAKTLIANFTGDLKCFPRFCQGDARELPFKDNSFDCVISERCLQNLPSREDQYQAIREVYRVLKNGAIFLMVEGTEDGLARLNVVRELTGLDPIPSTSSENITALRFYEEEINAFLREWFNIETVQFFGTYYLISRVVHPLLIYPESPRFDAKINTIARHVAEAIPDTGKLGHVMGYKLTARK